MICDKVYMNSDNYSLSQDLSSMEHGWLLPRLWLGSLAMSDN